MDKRKNPNKNNWILPNEVFPLYQMERRKLKWASTHQKATRSLQLIFFAPMLILFIIWIGFIYRDVLAASPNNSFIYYERYSVNYLWVVFAITVTILSFLLDFASMVVTFGSMGNEKVFGRWDLLVLAAEKEPIARSKHAFARLRIARVLTFNLSIRVAVLLLFLFTVTTDGYYMEYGTTLENIWRYLLDEPLGFLAIVTIASFIFAFYLLEPIWRVNAITAMGVALSARVRRIALLVPLAFVALALMWILQGIILAVITYGVTWIPTLIQGFYYDATGEYMNDWFWFVSYFILCSLYLIAAYLFYRTLKHLAYKRIYARIP